MNLAGRFENPTSEESIKRRPFRMRISRSPVNVGINARVPAAASRSEGNFA